MRLFIMLLYMYAAAALAAAAVALAAAALAATALAATALAAAARMRSKGKTCEQRMGTQSPIGKGTRLAAIASRVARPCSNL